MNKLKSSLQKKTGKALGLNKEKFEDEELPHELFLRTRQTTKRRNIFTNNMTTDWKLSKAQISKIIQSGVFFVSWLGNLGKKSIKNTAIPLAKDNLPRLVSHLTSIAINKFERKINERGAVRAGKGFISFYFEWGYEWYY